MGGSKSVIVFFQAHERKKVSLHQRQRATGGDGDRGSGETGEFLASLDHFPLHYSSGEKATIAVVVNIKSLSALCNKAAGRTTSSRITK